MVKKLLSYVGEYKKWVLLAPVLMVIEVLCEIILPRLMAAIVDVGIQYGDLEAILKNGALSLVLAAGGMAAADSGPVGASGLQTEVRWGHRGCRQRAVGASGLQTDDRCW